MYSKIFKNLHNIVNQLVTKHSKYVLIYFDIKKCKNKTINYVK